MNTKKAAKKKTAKQNKPPVGPEKYKRNQYGLLENVDYTFNEDGSVDWRSMIKPEFLYPNKGWFEARKKDVPTSIDGLKDNQLLIMLGGIKELARLRGFHNVSFDVENISEGYVTAKCNIDWIGNYESGDTAYDGTNTTVSYQDVANATSENTDVFCAKFLETIACNRAFVRCVRNFLNIHIVGADEIDKSSKEQNGPSVKYDNSEQETDSVQNIALTPHTMLQKAFKEKTGNDSFESFKELLRELWTSEAYRNDETKSWESFSDIPAKECRKILSIIKKTKDLGNSFSKQTLL